MKYCLEAGDAAVAAARQNPFVPTVLDIVLDGPSGCIIAGRLKKVRSLTEMLVLFMSSKVERAELFLENYDGRAEFLLKPFRKTDLRSAAMSLVAAEGRWAKSTRAPRKA